tara:strand:+ start:252 stop:656 length:405 start_codon:yes stop_codon:yes gene_type:complete
MLGAVDRRNKEFYSQLSDEQKKEFSPFMVMRWTSSIKGSKQLQEHYLELTNEFLNKDFSVLYKHKKLCWMLASIIGIGTNQYHPWIGVGKKTKKEILADRFSSLYPSLNQDELNILLSNKKAIQDIINQIDGKI